MAEYIEREKAIEHIETHLPYRCSEDFIEGQKDCVEQLKSLPSADVVEVVRCKDCKFATELNKHCEINRTAYRHCTLLHGDETRNVWHKYLKCYSDYSIVELDGYCSSGERRSE